MSFMQENEENKEEIVKKEAKEEINGKVYELGYLLVPTLSEENMPGVFGNLKELISSLGGVYISDEMPKMMTLAYPMLKVVANVRSKFSTAYFGWIKFTMDGEQVVELKSKLDFDPTIIRFLILKTVKENTIAAKRFVRSDTLHKKFKAKNDDVENVAPINKEEIDKEIDALVAA